jgi:hypothetical protein
MCRADYQGDNMASIVFSQFGSPYMQGLLRAVGSDHRALTNLVPCVLGTSQPVEGAKSGGPRMHQGGSISWRKAEEGYVRILSCTHPLPCALTGKVLEGVAPEAFHALIEDSTGSHVVEVVLEVAPAPLYEEMFSRFFKGRIQEMSQVGAREGRIWEGGSTGLHNRPQKLSPEPSHCRVPAPITLFRRCSLPPGLRRWPGPSLSSWAPPSGGCSRARGAEWWPALWLRAAAAACARKKCAQLCRWVGESGSEA